MSTSILSETGAVRLEKPLLEHLGVGPGDRLNLERRPDGRVELRTAPRRTSIRDLFDRLKRVDGPSLTLAEIEASAARGWAGER